METLTLKQISSMDSPALGAVLDYWKDYDPKSVLLAYAELKRRNYTISERLIKKVIEFCSIHNMQDIDNFLMIYMKENGFNSYEEYFEREIDMPKKVLAENFLKNTDSNLELSSNNYDKYPALRTISDIYRLFAWVIGIVTVIVAILFLSSGGMGVTFTLISIVLGGLIVVGVLAVAESIMVLIDIEKNTRPKK